MYRPLITDLSDLDNQMMDESIAAMKSGEPSPYWYCDWTKNRSLQFTVTLRAVLDETMSPCEAAAVLVAEEDSRSEWRLVLQHRTRSEIVSFMTAVMSRSAERRGQSFLIDAIVYARIEVLTHAVYFAMCEALLVDVPQRSSWQAVYASLEASAWREGDAGRLPYQGSVNPMSKRATTTDRQAFSWVPDDKLAIGLAGRVLGDFVPSLGGRYTDTDEGLVAARRVEDLMTHSRLLSLALAGTAHPHGSLGDSGNGQPFAVRLLRAAHVYASGMLICIMDKGGVPIVAPETPG